MPQRMQSDASFWMERRRLLSMITMAMTEGFREGIGKDTAIDVPPWALPGPRRGNPFPGLPTPP